MKVVLVMGGGVNQDYTLPDHVIDRVNHAADLVRDGDVVIFSALFTLNLPPVLTSNGYPVSEAVVMRDHFASVIGSKNITTFLENASFDTIGSAFFLRSLFEFCLTSSDVVIVTSDFHAERTSEVFKLIWNLAPALKVRSVQTAQTPTDGANFSARWVEERRKLKEFRILSCEFRKLDDFAHWLFTSHDNYANFHSKTQYKRGRDDHFKY